MKKTTITTLLILGALLMAGCNKDKNDGAAAGDIYHFAEESATFGVLDSEEWFEVPVVATLPHSEARNIGIEVVASASSAIEGVHYTLESHTLKLKADSDECAVRIKGNPEAFELNETLSLTLRLAVDNRYIDNSLASECIVSLKRCCPFDINNFTGYAVLTSSWCMQFMVSDSRLVKTKLDPEVEGGIIVEDMFYDGHDVGFTLNSDDRLNPTIAMPTTMMGSTGEAFGTIYGSGKILMEEVADYQSYYGTCEKFAVLYTNMYVEDFEAVGIFVSIVEWISDDEAERIKREGL